MGDYDCPYATSHFYDTVTSYQLLETATKETMPSASPISDFPKTFMEPEMLTFQQTHTASNGFEPSQPATFLTGNSMSSSSPSPPSPRKLANNFPSPSLPPPSSHHSTSNNFLNRRNEQNHLQDGDYHYSNASFLGMRCNNSNNNSNRYNPMQNLSDMANDSHFVKNGEQFSPTKSSSLSQLLAPNGENQNDERIKSRVDNRTFDPCPSRARCSPPISSLSNAMTKSDEINFRPLPFIAKHFKSEICEEFQNSDSDVLIDRYAVDLIRHHKKRNLLNSIVNPSSSSNTNDSANGSRTINSSDRCSSDNTPTSTTISCNNKNNINSNIISPHNNNCSDGYIDVQHGKIYMNLDNNNNSPKMRFGDEPSSAGRSSSFHESERLHPRNHHHYHHQRLLHERFPSRTSQIRSPSSLQSSSSTASSPTPPTSSTVSSSTPSATATIFSDPTLTPPPPPSSSSPSIHVITSTSIPENHSIQSYSHCPCVLTQPATKPPPNSFDNYSAHASSITNSNASPIPYSPSSAYSPFELRAPNKSFSVLSVPLPISTTEASSSRGYVSVNNQSKMGNGVCRNDNDADKDQNDHDDKTRVGDYEDSCPSRIRRKTFPCEPCDHFMEEDSQENSSSMTWTTKSPQFWTSSEVLDWLFYVAQEQGLDMQKLRAENFQRVSGDQLCAMETEDFVRLEPTFGLVIHDLLMGIMSDGSYPKPEVTSGCYGYSTPSPVYSSHSDSSHFEMATDHMTSSGQSFLQEATPLFGDTKQEASCVYQESDFRAHSDYFKQEVPDNPSMHFTPYNFDVNASSPSCIGGSQGLLYSSDCYLYQGTTASSTSSPLYPAAGTHPASHPASIPPSMRPPCCYSTPPPPHAPLPPPLHQPQTAQRRKPGRPRVKNMVQATKTSRDKKAKNQHLWEFIYEILQTPQYNPQFLKWENQREGVFRFVQSEAVAQLWGGRKNNENMTYEKLSRAMRHYYRRGILERVEGRRLVYKFSLKAIERMKGKKSNSP